MHLGDIKYLSIDFVFHCSDGSLLYTSKHFHNIGVLGLLIPILVITIICHHLSITLKTQLQYMS